MIFNSQLLKTTDLIKILDQVKNEIPLMAHMKGKVVSIESSHISDHNMIPKKILWLITEEEDNTLPCMTVLDALRSLRYHDPSLPIYIEDKGFIVEAGMAFLDAETPALWLYSEDD